MLSEAQNSKYNEYIANKTKINNTGIFCCYFSTSFRSANPNFKLRPKLGGQISLGQSKKTEWRTNSKSEVTHCTLSCGREVGDQNARSHGRGEFQRVHDLSLPIHNSKNYLQCTCTVHHSEPTIHTSDAFIISFHNSAVYHHPVCTHGRSC